MNAATEWYDVKEKPLPEANKESLLEAIHVGRENSELGLKHKWVMKFGEILYVKAVMSWAEINLPEVE